MPALNPSPLDAAVPGRTRRRVWKHPELKSHSLLVLTFDRLHLAPLAGDPKPETVAAAEAGADLDDLLGPLATEVVLAAVRQLRLDLLANSLIVEYAAGAHGHSRLTITFATPEAADACFTKVWRRLGDGFELLPFRRDPWAAAKTPLLMLAVVLALTAVLAVGLSVFEDFAARRTDGAVSVPPAGEFGTPVHLPKSPPGGLFDWLNWRVVCGVGGAVAAGLQVWLYRRLTQPPVSLELSRT
jgi:hypothetical protein